MLSLQATAPVRLYVRAVQQQLRELLLTMPAEQEDNEDVRFDLHISPSQGSLRKTASIFLQQKGKEPSIVTIQY